MHTRLIGAILSLILVGGIWFWWTRIPTEIQSVDSNLLVETVTLTPLTLDPEAKPRFELVNGVPPVPLEQRPEDVVPFDDTISTPTHRGQYIQIDLKHSETLPETINGVAVMPPEQWPLTMMVYRPGDPDGQTGFEFQGLRMQWSPVTRESEEPSEAFRLPVFVGRTETRSSMGFVGSPDIGPEEDGQNLYWVFLIPPDQESPAGEYVYEVRLYPTAHWVSSVRSDRGEPVILRRGKLIAEMPQNSKTELMKVEDE